MTIALIGALLTAIFVLGVVLARARRARAVVVVNSGEIVYGDLVDYSVAAVAIIRDGRIIYANQACRLMFGARRQDDVVGKDLLKFVLPSLEYTVQATARSLEEALLQTSILEQRLQTIDGRKLDVELMSLYTVYEGKPALQVTFRDITQKKESEAEILKQEQRFRSLIENLHEAIAILNTEAVPNYVSPSSRQMLGYRVVEVVGRSLLDFVHPEDQARVRQVFAELATDPQAVRYAEFRLRHQDGSWRHIDLTGQNLTKEPAVAGIVVNYRDVTDRKLGEAALRESEGQLRHVQKMEAIGRLAGSVAHDFNNVLTVINGFSSMMLDRMAPRDPLRPQLLEVRKAGERGARLTGQLLSFSRRSRTNPVPVDLNAVVLEMAMMLQRLMGETVQVVTRVDPRLPRVLADPSQVQQVLMNLAVNARDAMPQGGRLEIETTALAGASPRVRLLVRDSGCGMDEATRQRIFEPYFTTKPVGQGTGLGLAIVFGIVTGANGAIAVESAPGRGTTLIIDWPQAASSAVPDASPELKAVMSRGTETILVVEDDPIIRLLAREILEPLGYRVLESGNGDEALVLTDRYSGPIHLALIDVVIPGLGSSELSERLRARRPEIKELFTSGYADEASVHPLLRNGNVAFLEKPFTGEILTAKIREVLAG